MELLRLNVLNYFHKKLHQKCTIAFYVRPWSDILFLSCYSLHTVVGNRFIEVIKDMLYFPSIVFEQTGSKQVQL